MVPAVAVVVVMVVGGGDVGIGVGVGSGDRDGRGLWWWCWRWRWRWDVVVVVVVVAAGQRVCLSACMLLLELYLVTDICGDLSQRLLRTEYHTQNPNRPPTHTQRLRCFVPTGGGGGGDGDGCRRGGGDSGGGGRGGGEESRGGAVVGGRLSGFTATRRDGDEEPSRGWVAVRLGSGEGGCVLLCLCSCLVGCFDCWLAGWFSVLWGDWVLV